MQYQGWESCLCETFDLAHWPQKGCNETGTYAVIADLAHREMVPLRLNKFGCIIRPERFSNVEQSIYFLPQ